VSVTGVVAISFLTVKNAIGAMGVFLLFGSRTPVALLYFWREVPETKGRSLQEMDRDLVGRGVG
jgi:hypothetical protein